MSRAQAHWRNTATVQVDIDSLDTIARGYGLSRPEGTGPDPIIAAAVPRYLDLFHSFGIKATFFVVGRDLELDANIPLFQSLLDAGHELANHSYCHVGFDHLDAQEQAQDMARCHELVQTRLGVACQGFKAPCYAVTSDTVATLRKMGYAYDSSMIATVLSPVIKTYYRLLLRKPIHPDNWGRPMHLFSPRSPYRPDPGHIWRPGPAEILMVPVTTFPFLKIPFHFSFINVTGPLLSNAYFALAGVLPDNFLNFAFHAVDLVPSAQLPEALRNRPGLRRPDGWREAQARRVLGATTKRYRVVPTEGLVAMASEAS